jgi:hypothetical protein
MKRNIKELLELLLVFQLYPEGQNLLSNFRFTRDRMLCKLWKLACEEEIVAIVQNPQTKMIILLYNSIGRRLSSD